MPPADSETLAVYARSVEDYVALTAEAAKDTELAAFIAAMPDRAEALDLGCGPGHAAAAMQAAGLRVEALDASPEMAEIAQRLHGLQVRIAGFGDVTDTDRFDGIWASFSLLHAPRVEMPGHLARLYRALRPGGRLTLGLKTGDGERRDRLGRFYTYYSVDELLGLLGAAGFVVTDHRTGSGTGLDGTVAPWVVVHANA